jgi:anti-anti-sigma regulatory factor
VSNYPRLSPQGRIIDIADLRYIDWPGLSVLITTQKAVGKRGGSLVVRHPTKAA